MAKKYKLRFRRYTRQELPHGPGIYCVYTGYRRNGRLKNLLYIGEAGNIWGRADPERQDAACWSESLVRGEALFFTAAEFRGSKSDRLRVENALIYEHRPPCNKQGVNNFDRPDTTVITKGDNHQLRDRFTIAQPREEPDSQGWFGWFR